MRALPALLAALMMSSAWAQEPVRLYAAGSLRAAMNDVAAEFERASGIAVRGEYGPSGLLRGRVEKGEPVALFVLSVPGQKVLARYGFTPVTLP